MFAWQRRPRFHLTITGEAWEIEMCYHGNKRREGQHPVAAIQGCTERRCDYWELWSFQRCGLDLEASIKKKKKKQHHHFLELYDSLQKILINIPSVCGAELDFVLLGRPLGTGPVLWTKCSSKCWRVESSPAKSEVGSGLHVFLQKP